MKRGDKRGQFYLIAAIVLISIIIGFATIKNYSKKATTKVYDLSDELDIESDQVVGYGIVNGKTMENLMANFTGKYAKYLQEDVDNLFFIFGNFEDGIKVVTYKEIIQGGIRIGGTEIKITRDQSFVYTPKIETNSEGIKTIKVLIENKDKEKIEYEFELKPGENFYYIMQKTEGGQEFSIDNSRGRMKNEE